MTDELLEQQYLDVLEEIGFLEKDISMSDSVGKVAVCFGICGKI